MTCHEEFKHLYIPICLHIFKCHLFLLCRHGSLAKTFETGCMFGGSPSTSHMCHGCSSREAAFSRWPFYRSWRFAWMHGGLAGRTQPQQVALRDQASSPDYVEDCPRPWVASFFEFLMVQVAPPGSQWDDTKQEESTEPWKTTRCSQCEPRKNGQANFRRPSRWIYANWPGAAPFTETKWTSKVQGL